MGCYLRRKSWYYNFYYEGKRYNEKIGPVSESVAKEKLTIKKAEVIRGEWKPKVKKISFEDFSKEFMEKYAKINVKPASYTTHESSLKHLIPFFGNQSLSEINSFFVEKYKLTRKTEGTEPATINRELACLRQILNMAVSWKKLRSLPFCFGKRKDVKFLQEPEPRDRILSYEEEARLFEIVRSECKMKHLEPIIITALNTGLRKQNILRLQWSQVDFKNNLITISKTKTGKVVKIPLNKKLTETLESGKKISKSEYVFSENGKPYGDVKTGWWSALKKAKIEGFRFHDLRHTFGTRLAMNGYDLKTIMELMAISDPKVAMRYLNPTAQHKREAVESLDRVTTILTTEAKTPERAKVVNIGNH
jgi:integrase